jgi:DNA-binding MarR family transcriptional regulator
MSKSLNPELELHNLDEKIVFAIERISRILRILLWDVAKEEKLSPIQIQFLIFISHQPEEYRRISELAREYGLTQATVSDAVKSLETKGLIHRKVWKQDGRISSLHLTSAGRALVKKVSGWYDVLETHIRKFPLETKESLIVFFLELIKSLQTAGVISVARICLTFENFQRDMHANQQKTYRCELTGTPLSNVDLKVDCEGHELKQILSTSE